MPFDASVVQHVFSGIAFWLHMNAFPLRLGMCDYVQTQSGHEGVSDHGPPFGHVRSFTNEVCSWKRLESLSCKRCLCAQACDLGFKSSGLASEASFVASSWPTANTFGKLCQTKKPDWLRCGTTRTVRHPARSPSCFDVTSPRLPACFATRR